MDKYELLLLLWVWLTYNLSLEAAARFTEKFKYKMVNKVQVKIEDGILEGLLTKTTYDLPFKSFTRIPFAKPPLGELRFKDPVPNDKWEGVLDATHDMECCSQFDIFFKKKYFGVEDCLYLNVYVPKDVKEGDNVAVMFWVHGGAFLSGGGNTDIYGPDHLISNNIIMVAINYRLGPLGFLCLDIEEAPGNMGLKDQVMALRWVKKNISAFGGDPKNVTIFGESAGGSSVHHLIMSPMTKGLITRAIYQSGCSLCEWSNCESVEQSAFDLGQKLGLKTNDKLELLKYLKGIPVEKLMMASMGQLKQHFLFTPVIEKNIPNVTAFCTEDVRNRMIKGDFPKIPVMGGYTSNEGFLVLVLKADDLNLNKIEDLDLSKLVSDFKVYVPLHIQSKLNSTKMDVVAQKIKQRFFPNDKNIFKSYCTLESEYTGLKDIQVVTQYFAKRNLTYLYRFDYKGSLNLMQILSPIPYEGACHADELGYLFMPNMAEIVGRSPEADITEKDELTVKRMTKLWTNFAKYGDPTPELDDIITTKWEPASGEKIPVMNIGDTLTLMDDMPRDIVNFWNELENL